MPGTTGNFCFKLLECIYRMGSKTKPSCSTRGSQITYGCFLKWWYPQNNPKWSFLVGNPWLLGKPTILGNTHILVGWNTAKMAIFSDFALKISACFVGVWRQISWLPFGGSKIVDFFFVGEVFCPTDRATAQFRLFSARTGTALQVDFGTGWWHLKNPWWFRINLVRLGTLKRTK